MKHSEIDFSIVIPAYNMENYILKTLESVCKNHLEHCEIIVVDDGSSDETAMIAKNYFEENQIDQYQILKQENKGVSAARNLGIQNANGRYLIFCDSDDYCKDNLLEAIDSQKSANYDLLFWQYEIQDEKGSTTAKCMFHHPKLTAEEALEGFLLKGNRIRLGSFAVKKDLIEKYSIFFSEGCSVGEDMEFIYKCISASSYLYFVEKVLFTYVKRMGSAMNHYNLKRFEAPMAMKRVNEFVEINQIDLKNSELRNYLKNALVILHSIFSFDACIQYLQSTSDIKVFQKKYRKDYKELEKEIKRCFHEAKLYPDLISKKRMMIFKFNRSLYIYLYGLQNLKRKK